MSFLDKARQAANQAAEQARHATEQARLRATDPSTAEKARQAMSQAGTSARQAAGAAKRGFGTMVERIDPGLLADVVIKATALQEKANKALRDKGSPYRINEVLITAAIPPQVGFSITRVIEIDEVITGKEVDSTQLVQEGQTEAESPVMSLDGTVDQAALEEALEDEASSS
ncbi:MAG TPA: hypothetical protein VNF73_17715 [Candidatus Saccharimonadales bacterium]|nr:hypothetical protein [Candidatus Saccharimonadales bacterium]